MTKGLEQVKFLSFCILVKNRYRNSAILGSKAIISKKINLSYYLVSNQINYGLKNGLIEKINGGYRLKSYKKILDSIDAIKYIKYVHLSKNGNFKELIIKNLYRIAHVNFNQQLFKGKRSEKIREIRKLATVESGLTNQFSKKDYNLYKASKNRVLGENFIVTGQKHLSKLLFISQGQANNLLNIWANMGLIYRTIMYSSAFDKNEYNYSLSLNKPMICLGSKIVLNP